MALIGNVVSADEKTWQMKFYETIFGSPDEITVDRSTDGYTKGIIFEHKQNVHFQKMKLSNLPKNSINNTKIDIRCQ